MIQHPIRCHSQRKIRKRTQLLFRLLPSPRRLFARRGRCIVRCFAFLTRGRGRGVLRRLQAHNGRLSRLAIGQTRHLCLRRRPVHLAVNRIPAHTQITKASSCQHSDQSACEQQCIGNVLAHVQGVDHLALVLAHRLDLLVAGLLELVLQIRVGLSER